jgi:type IX secretion system PorP/SprF family membrane protein
MNSRNFPDKLSIAFLSIAFLPFSAFSQESLIYTNYYLNPFIINPAATGAEIYPQADLSINKQWLAFPNSPSTFSLAGNCRVGFWDFYDPKGFVNRGPLKLKDRVGLGATILKDNNGPLSTTSILISYAYHIPINEDSRLSLGMSLIGSFYSMNTSILKPDQSNDPYLYSGNSNSFRSNFCLGAYYYCSSYFAGLSATKLLPDISNADDQLKEQPGLFLIGGYKLMKNSNSFSLEPSFTLKKTANANVSCDMHAKLYVKKLNWIAISYSTTQNINIMLGLHLYKMVYLGYNYGYTVSKIASYNYGSHEIHLGINLGLIGAEGIRTTVDDTK